MEPTELRDPPQNKLRYRYGGSRPPLVNRTGSAVSAGGHAPPAGMGGFADTSRAASPSRIYALAGSRRAFRVPRGKANRPGDRARRH
jgi:hypothetical protein